MKGWQLHTPVAFLIFNRPDTAGRVFEEIRRARPPKLLAVADGPRPDRPGEAERCAAVRAIIERVDWPCELVKNYADTNLGCKRRVSSGLDWVFETVEEAIILEDDCLPHPTFFRFCDELLDRYRDDERVMHISGDNFQFGRKRGDASYYFSRYPHIWGWASWRRAWRHYDVEMTEWRSAGDKEAYLSAFRTSDERRFFREVWNGVCEGRIDTWDYQWGFACAARKGLVVLPNVNLVTNLGFAGDATHTHAGSPVAALPSEAMVFPLKHPEGFQWDDEADEVTRRIFFVQDALWMRAVRKIWREAHARLSKSGQGVT